jgi:hypothetical protein
MILISKIWKRVKSRTIWFAATIGVVGPQIIETMPLLQDWLGDNYKIALFAVGLLIYLFREITKTSLDEK